MLEYQDHGYGVLEYEIISHEILIARSYNLMHPTQPEMIDSYTYLHLYHKPPLQIIYTNIAI